MQRRHSLASGMEWGSLVPGGSAGSLLQTCHSGDAAMVQGHMTSGSEDLQLPDKVPKGIPASATAVQDWG